MGCRADARRAGSTRDRAKLPASPARARAVSRAAAKISALPYPSRHRFALCALVDHGPNDLAAARRITMGSEQLRPFPPPFGEPAATQGIGDQRLQTFTQCCGIPAGIEHAALAVFH